ncbi:MAG: hypothetical protein HC767_04185 [Akkermansiaceae bacterium]|nr:hypothetical protein [Akkermansiaceae bacterium]
MPQFTVLMRFRLKAAKRWSRLLQQATVLDIYGQLCALGTCLRPFEISADMTGFLCNKATVVLADSRAFQAHTAEGQWSHSKRAIAINRPKEQKKCASYHSPDFCLEFS